MYQQICGVEKSLQDIVDDMQKIQTKCARDKNDNNSEAKKRKWIWYKHSLSELHRRGGQLMLELSVVFQCDSADKLAQVTRKMDMLIW